MTIDSNQNQEVVREEQFQVVQPDGGGLRYSQGKLRYDLFPPDAEREVVRVYTRGAEKYAERNWERGMKWSECLRALKSHLNKWENGETFDDELTDCRHMAQVAWNALALLTYELREIGENNIPGKQPKPVVFQNSTEGFRNAYQESEHIRNVYGLSPTIADDIDYFRSKMLQSVGINDAHVKGSTV